MTAIGRGGRFAARYACGVLFLFVASHCAPSAESRTGSSAMETLQPESIPVVPESPSLILRATHIILVRIASADVRPWANRADGMPERAADLVLELEEILKGDVDGHTGDRFRLEITQTGRPGTRVFALPGVWSDLPLD